MSELPRFLIVPIILLKLLFIKYWHLPPRNSLNVDASIELLKLDDDLVESDPPLLVAPILRARTQKDADIGRILYRLHKNHKSDRAKRFFTV